jgi:hypothetical protein
VKQPLGATCDQNAPPSGKNGDVKAPCLPAGVAPLADDARAAVAAVQDSKDHAAQGGAGGPPHKAPPRNRGAGLAVNLNLNVTFYLLARIIN